MANSRNCQVGGDHAHQPIDAGTMCRTASPSPGTIGSDAAPKRKSHVPLVTNLDDAIYIGDLTLGESGGTVVKAGWFVTLRIRENAARNGHIIQKVKTPDITYYEAWEVMAGTRKPVSGNVMKSHENVNADDAFLVECHKGTRGKWEVSARVMFYEGRLPTSFGSGEVEEARMLKSSKSAPMFWTGKGIRRLFICQWDLRSSDSDNWKVSVEATIRNADGSGKRKTETRTDFD